MEEHIIRRLIYSKALLLHGIEHSKENETMDTVLAVLHFDNSIEMLLNIILEYFGAPYKRERNFHELIEAVNQLVKKEKSNVDSDSLLKVRDIKNLHVARNVIQHNGIIPAIDEVRRYRILTKNLVEDVVSQLFEVDFDDISLSILIKDEEIRELCKNADSSFERAEYRESMIYSVAAFETAKNKEQNRIYGSGIAWHMMSGSFTLKKDVNLYFQKVVEELEILKLRLDYKKYQKYRDISHDLSPFFQPSSENKIAKIERIIGKEIDRLKKTSLKDCARFYLSFSIESILRWESVSRKGWLQRELEKIQPYENNSE